MYSVLHPDFVYTDISDEIAEHDLNYDAEEWNYNGKDVYRGCLDRKYEWNVFWLYDENLKRVGLAEHDRENPQVFYALWFCSNPFSTLLQESEWISQKETIWSKLTEEAYEDCLEDDIETFINKTLHSNTRLITPEFLIKMPEIYHCEKCDKRTLSLPSSCSEVKKLEYIISDNNLIFISSLFEIYKAPADSVVWNRLIREEPSLQQPDASEHPLVQEEQGLPLQLTEQPPQLLSE
jgi:hypothetical protein